MPKKLDLTDNLEKYIIDHSDDLTDVQKEILNYNLSLGDQKKLQISISQAQFLQTLIKASNTKKVLVECAYFNPEEIIGKTNASLEFTLTIEDTDINGIDLITWNEAGLITEFKVFIRPLQGVNIIHKMMGNMLESFKNVS